MMLKRVRVFVVPFFFHAQRGLFFWMWRVVRKGFFLLFEFLLALLIFSSVYLASHTQKIENNSAYRLSEVVCTDLLSIWLLGEDDISLVARQMLPHSSISLSTSPIFPQKPHSFVCFAQRLHNGVFDTQYILIEW